jgi:hypothetical protein
MLDELITTDKVVEEVLIDLMAEKVMSFGIQASSMRGVQASPLISRGSEPSIPVTKKRAKHRDDLANANLILIILPKYILPLTRAVSCDNVPRDFYYTMVTKYLPKGIHACWHRGKPKVQCYNNAPTKP